MRPDSILPASLVRYLAAMVTGVIVGCWTVPGYCQDDETFLSFPPELVPAPDELGRKLVELGAVNPSAISSEILDTLRQQGLEMLSELTPEQQRNLAGLAEQYLRDRGIRPSDIPPERLPDLARQLQDQLGDIPELDQRFEEFRERFEEYQRQQSRRETRSESPWSNQFPMERRNVQPPPVPNPVRPEPGRETPPEWVVPEEFPEHNNSRPELSVPQPGEQRPGVGQPNIPATGEPPELEIPGWNSEERIGVRFDRLLVEAAERGMRSTDSATRSRLAQSVNSLLDGLAKNIDTTIRNHSSRNRSRQSAASWTSGSRRSPLFNWSSGSGDFYVPEISPWWLLVPVAMGLAIWLLLRTTGITDRWSTDETGRRRVHYRFQPVRNPEALVRSLDRLLLARFGRRANWWDVRRAQHELENIDLRKVSVGRLDELAEAYELARYSPSAGAMTPAQLEQLSDTLRDLAEDESLTAHDDSVPANATT